ncbi:phosphatase 2C-like domain-containing protein [Phlyctochytrium arcticum]|nr:phosphatase 2C-like domain-containing protein [Phlyctochytrium arcticum]
MNSASQKPGLSSWAGLTLSGWKDIGSGSREPLHPTNEDVIYVPDDDATVDPKKGFQIFCVADGHGGREAAGWFCERAVASAKSKLAERFWNLSESSELEHLRTFFDKMIKDLDKQFCALRESQYAALLTDNTLSSVQSGHPIDDGTTLNLGILLYEEWFITVHVGDSRTVVGRTNQIGRTRSSSPGYSRWYLTKDHSVAHAQKALHVRERGGILKESRSSKAITQLIPPNAKYPVRFLENARVFRPDDFVNPYGFPIKNLGMSDALGDVVMKLPPRLFEGAPDVEVLHLEPGRGHLIIMASDGLWTAVDGRGDAEVEVERVLEAYNRDVPPHDPIEATVRGSSAQRLGSYVEALCLRDSGYLSEIFVSTSSVHDDISIVAIEIHPALIAEDDT